MLEFIECTIIFLGDEIPQLLDLYKDVVPKYAARWKDLGIALKIPHNHLDTIEIDNFRHPSHSKQCCKDILHKWMEVTPNPTWNILQKAIDGLPLLSHDGNSKSKNTMCLAYLLCKLSNCMCIQSCY